MEAKASTAGPLCCWTSESGPLGPGPRERKYLSANRMPVLREIKRIMATQHVAKWEAMRRVQLEKDSIRNCSMKKFCMIIKKRA